LRFGRTVPRRARWHGQAGGQWHRRRAAIRRGAWTATVRASIATGDVVRAVCVARSNGMAIWRRDAMRDCGWGAVGPNRRRRVAPSPTWLTPREGVKTRFPKSPVTQSSLTARPSLRRGQYYPAIIGCPASLLRCRSIHFSQLPNRIRKPAWFPAVGGGLLPAPCN
jgi:hypothetical protein